ncbi:Putative transcriptional regulator, TetR family [Mycobacteroides abscessus subsp. massiliense]|nr:Putative transcriptional regulator, TetR family [Mycobacteroides abscessus subsp. massiliense]
MAEEGLRQFSGAQADVPQTDDPIADFMVTGMVYRQFAIDHPHMYRLMFGVTSAHGINAPSRNMFNTVHLTPQHASATQLYRSVQPCTGSSCWSWPGSGARTVKPLAPCWAP